MVYDLLGIAFIRYNIIIIFIINSTLVAINDRPTSRCQGYSYLFSPSLSQVTFVISMEHVWLEASNKFRHFLAYINYLKVRYNNTIVFKINLTAERVKR